MKRSIIFLVVAVILIFLLTWAANSLPGGNSVKNPSSVQKTKTPSTESGTSYTLAQVSAHARASDCWSIVQNGVYNLTSWINQHPGGSGAILQMCGRDATDAFLGQHGGQRRPESELQGFLIGTYKK